MRITAGQAAKIENDGIHRLRLRIAPHVNMAVQMHLCPQSLLPQQLLRLRHRLLLDIKGKHSAGGSCQTAQQRRVPALSGGGVNAQRTRLDVFLQKTVDYAQRISLHHTLFPVSVHQKAA